MNLSKRLRDLWRSAGMYNFSRVANPFYDLFTGGRRRSVFFDIDATYPSLRRLDRAWCEIREELDRLMPQQDRMPKYHELDSDLLNSSARYHRKSRWNVFMLYCYGSRPEHNRALCPKTCALLDEIPYLNQAFFSILDPGKSIPAHSGPTRAYLRYHLGLRVPSTNPPSIRVKDQHYTWREGESVLFDDSWNHEITNHAEEIRAVLIVDVMRPFIRPVFVLNLGLRKLAERLYGPKVIAKADQFRLDLDPPITTR